MIALIASFLVGCQKSNGVFLETQSAFKVIAHISHPDIKNLSKVTSD
jgi:hypothetical protein